jgi:uncharacterized protein (TIGR00725 family)
MNAIYSLDRAAAILSDAAGRVFDPRSRQWSAGVGGASGESVDARGAVAWVQRESGAPIRVPVGVIGPREANPAQLAAAEGVGAGLAAMGLAVVCGGRQGVMEATCRGAARSGGLTIGILPDADPAFANPFVGVVLATGIGEARNALIARASFCLIAIGDSYGTLSEVAFGRQFGKLVVGLEGAAAVDGVVQVDGVAAALDAVAAFALGR